MVLSWRSADFLSEGRKWGVRSVVVAFGVFSEQLPCRSAEVKNFSVFLCQRCREIWREILVKFSLLDFPGFGCPRESFAKIHAKNGVKNGKFHVNLTLRLGHGADVFGAPRISI